MKSTVVDESLSSFKPMYCSREYQTSTRLIQQYEKSTLRIKRLLEVLRAYSFNLSYMKGKNMILSDYLSRQRIDDSNPHEIIPLLIDMQAILRDRHYNIG